MTATPTSQPSDYDATGSSVPVPSPDMWPTRQAHDAAAGDPKRVGRYGTKHGGRNLTDEVHLWPTPSASDGMGSRTLRPGTTTTGMTPDGAKQYVGRNNAVKQAMPQDASAPLTSSTAARPASPLAQRVSALVQAIAGGAGPSSSESLASYSPAGYWQRIQPALFPCDMEMGSRPLDEYSQNWPRWGTALAGASGALLMSALRTGANACSSWAGEQTSAPLESAWPTPTVPNGGRSPKGGMSPTGMTPEGIKRQVDLGHHVRNVEQGLWMTPIANDAMGKDHAPSMQQRRPTRQQGRPLCIQVHESAARAWPSPRASDGAKGGPNQAGSKGDLMLPSAVVQAEASTDSCGTCSPPNGSGRLAPPGSAWPTPAARDWKSGQASPETLERNSRPLSEMVTAQTRVSSGQLNPAWVTGLMGFPQGWLDIPGPPVRAKRSTTAKRPVLRRASPSG